MIIHEIESLIAEVGYQGPGVNTPGADAWQAMRKAGETLIDNAMNAIKSDNTEESFLQKSATLALHSFKKIKDKFDATNWTASGSKTGGSNLDASEPAIGGGHGPNLDDNYIGQSNKWEPNGYDPKSNLDDIPDGIDPLNFATKSRANSAEMFKDIKQTFQFTGNFLDRLSKKSEDIADVISDYFVPFQKNPIVGDLVELSNNNPHLFNAMIVAVPAILIGAVGGTYSYIKKIKTVNDAKVELDKATTELDNASSDSAKAAASKKVALIGAKAIVLAKASK